MSDVDPNAPAFDSGPGGFRSADSLGRNPVMDKWVTPAPLGVVALTAADDPQIVRLREIRQLVKANNQSSLPEDVVICQIYMESRFKAKAGEGHDAKGLMQLQKNAVRQVFKYRKQKELKHMPSDKDTAAAFKEADKLHASADIFDEATNIKLGTEYMQYWLDVTDTVEAAYKRYRGVNNGVYYKKIKAAADKLAKDPENMQILLDLIG
jgi:soluble lytic murein transglycosylase-like protein